MKFDKKIKFLLLIGIFIISNINIFNLSESNNQNDEKNFSNNGIGKAPETNGFWEVNYIHIQKDNWSDSGVAWIKPASGTKNDPHIIENVKINATDKQRGIFIQDSEEYFIIQNCMVFNALNDGIRLENASFGIIDNNNCSNNGKYGIRLYYKSVNNTISNNIIGNYGNGVQECGIGLYSCSNNSIIKNHVFNNDKKGIYLQSVCKNNTIFENTIVNYDAITPKQDYGIILNITCDGNEILANHIEKSSLVGARIHTDNCYNNIFYYNAFIDNLDDADVHTAGLGNVWDNGKVGNYWKGFIDGDTQAPIGIWDTPYVDTNLMDNYPLVVSPLLEGGTIHIDETGVNANNWSQTALLNYWCSGSGTKDDPFLLKDQIINASGTAASPILIENSQDVTFIIKNCKTTNSDSLTFWDAGIQLYNTSHGLIVNNTIIDNDWNGISLYNNCTNNTIINNNVSNNYFDGIFLSLNCSGNIIIDNEIMLNSHDGILMENNCTENQILGNIIKNDDFVYEQEIGIHLRAQCSNNTIENNTIENNYQGAIILYDRCNNNTIRNNILYNNYPYGIYLWSDCDENRIINNTILFHTNGIKSFYDCSENLITQNTITGNAYGINISSSSIDNLIFKNYLDNTLINGYDDGSNDWNSSLIGNFWADYHGPDNNKDSIGDIPYDISGGSNKDYKPIMNYAAHPPILIDELGKGDYTWEEASAEFWCSGEGTESNPYIIKNLRIDLESEINRAYGIMVNNSRSHFIIQDCIISNGADGTWDGGIKIWNSTNGKLLFNNASYCRRGALLYNCSNIVISNNILNDNQVTSGVDLWNSHNNTIKNNIACRNIMGIRLQDGSCDNLILNNTVNANFDYTGDGIDCYGIYLKDQSNYNRIFNNSGHHNSKSGITIAWNSSYNTVSYNNFSLNRQTGIIIANSEYINISYNIVDDIYYKVQWTTGRGIELSNVNYTNIIGNSIRRTHIQSIYLSYGHHLNITDNIGVTFYARWVEYLNITNNFFNATGNVYTFGIFDAIYNTIANNILYYEMNEALRLDDCDHSIFQDNIINGTYSIGLYDGMYIVRGNDYNQFIGNVFKDNQRYGIEIFHEAVPTESRNLYNVFYLNKFINSGVGGTNVMDNTPSGYNSWDNGSIGNYWDDYSGEDVNDDGIGDSPYISGYADDYYPIYSDEVDIPQIVSILQDPTDPSETDTVNITVQITDNIAAHKVYIYSNHSGVMTAYEMDFLSGATNDGYWNYTIPALSLGTIVNYSIWVNDSDANSNTNGPYFYLVDATPPQIISISLNSNDGNQGIVNITAHITDNLKIDSVLIYSNHSGVNTSYSMTLISGNYKDGYWFFSIPEQAINTTVVYSIWANDTNNNHAMDGPYQYTIEKVDDSSEENEKDDGADDEGKEDDDIDPNKIAIPNGNYYLYFLVLSSVVLVILKRKKVNQN